MLREAVITTPVTQPGYHTGREAPNKGRAFPPEILTTGEVKSLIEACSNRGFTQKRDR